MMSKTTVTTIGGATIDTMFYTKDMVILDNPKDLLRQKLIGFEYGAKVYSDKVYFTQGGGGSNAAACLAKLGIKTRAILSVGHDINGLDIISHLSDLGVNTKLIQIQKNQRTGASFVINVGQHNEHVLFAYRGANDGLSLDRKVYKNIKSGWVYLPSLPTKSSSQTENFFEHCRRHRVKIAWNPGQKQFTWSRARLLKTLPMIHTLIVNRDEAIQLAKTLAPKQANNNIKNLFKILARGQKLTAITDGPKGAYLYDNKDVIFSKALDRKPLNTTGAGDCFGSSLIAGLIRYNGDLKRAMRLAIINSNSIIMKIGAQTGQLRASELKKYHL